MYETGTRRFHRLEAAAREPGHSRILRLPADAAPVSPVPPLCRDIEASWGDLEALITFLMCFVPLLLWFFIRLLRKTAKLFWRCPCCRQPFPYYAPDGRVDALREKDCYASLRHLRIPYVKTKLCPLVIPSECPSCRRKFFEMEQNSLNGEKTL